MKDILNRIIEALDSNLKEKGTYIQFNSKNYRPIPFSKDNFKEIRDLDIKNKAAFIDGGNAEIMKAANFSLQLIRIYCTIYKENKRINSKKLEFYVLVSAVDKEGKIEYKTGIFPINCNFETLRFDSFDSSIKQGNNRVKVSKIGEIIRKLAEIKAAEELIDVLSEGDIIVRDGDLKASATYEKEYFENLYKKALEKNIIVTGLSKTSELFTDKGNSLQAAINELAPEHEWYYYPLVEIDNEAHKSDMYLIKLNKKSEYVFKFEAFKKNKYDIDKIMSLLKKNSSDPVFIGYPYGLIEADRFARIPNKEIDSLKMQLIAKAGSRWPKLKCCLSAANAHDILDKIS